MESFVDIELGFDRHGDGLYKVDFRCIMPGNEADTRLGQGDFVFVKIDIKALGRLATENEPPQISITGKTSYSKNCGTINLGGKIDDSGLGAPERDKVSFRWEKISGPDVTISNGNINNDGTLNSTVEITDGKLGVGQYICKLTVTNPSFDTGKELTIKVS